MLREIVPEDLQGTAAVFSDSAKLGMKIYEEVRKRQKADELKAGTELQESIKPLLAQYMDQKPFIFTGSITDLSYFWSNRPLSEQIISDIPNERIKNAVNKTLQNLQQAQMITYDDNTKSYILTAEGNSYIYSSEFVNMAFKSNIEQDFKVAVTAEKMVAEQKRTSTPSESASTAPQRANEDKAKPVDESAEEAAIEPQAIVSKVINETAEIVEETEELLTEHNDVNFSELGKSVMDAAWNGKGDTVLYVADLDNLNHENVITIIGTVNEVSHENFRPDYSFQYKEQSFEAESAEKMLKEFKHPKVCTKEQLEQLIKAEEQALTEKMRKAVTPDTEQAIKEVIGEKVAKQGVEKTKEEITGAKLRELIEKKVEKDNGVNLSKLSDSVKNAAWNGEGNDVLYVVDIDNFSHENVITVIGTINEINHEEFSPECGFQYKDHSLKEESVDKIIKEFEHPKVCTKEQLEQLIKAEKPVRVDKQIAGQAEGTATVSQKGTIKTQPTTKNAVVQGTKKAAKKTTATKSVEKATEKVAAKSATKAVTEVATGAALGATTAGLGTAAKVVYDVLNHTNTFVNKQIR